MGRRELDSRGPVEVRAAEELRDQADGGRRGNEEFGIAADGAGVAPVGTDEDAAEIRRALEWSLEAVLEDHRSLEGSPDLAIDGDIGSPQQDDADGLGAFLVTLGHEQALLATEIDRLDAEVERVLAGLRGQSLSPDERYRLLEWCADAEAVVGALQEQLESARSFLGHGAIEDHTTLARLEASQAIVKAQVGAITLRVRDACGTVDPDQEEVGHGTR